MLIVYNFIVFVLVLLYIPFIISRILIRKKEWLERLGAVQNIEKRKYILVHCASVGEVNLVRLFIDKLANEFSEYKILLSVVTPSGYALAVKLHLPVEQIFFLPIDFYFFIRNFIRKIQPEVLILVEAELWPNLIYLADKFNTKIILVNGRISHRTYKFRYLLKVFLRNALNKVDLLLMREQTDIKRIIKLGAEEKKVLLTGNMKYDFVPEIRRPAEAGAQKLEIRKEFGFSATDRIFTAGSVREGEEKLVIEAYLEVKNKFNDLKLIIAPRHLNRIAIIEKLLNQNSISFICKSQLSTINHGFTLPTTHYVNYVRSPHQRCGIPHHEWWRITSNGVNSVTLCSARPASRRESGEGQGFFRGSCLILDTFGDLISVYEISDLVFVGGTLLPYGGHNIIEPASLGKVVVFGPYISNFQEPADMLLKNNAAIQINNPNQLKNVIIDFFTNPAKYQSVSANAKNVIDSLKGATDRNIKYIKECISRKPCNHRDTET